MPEPFRVAINEILHRKVKEFEAEAMDVKMQGYEEQSPES